MAKKSETTASAKKKNSTATSSKSAKSSGSSSGKSASNSKSGSKSAPAKKSGASAKSASPAKTAPVKNPVRREIGGVVCIVLALLSFIGYFDVDALFFVLTDVLKGLIGYGYWILPPCMIWTGYVLLTHRGRPVRLRMTAILLLPLLWCSLPVSHQF